MRIRLPKKRVHLVWLLCLPLVLIIMGAFLLTKNKQTQDDSQRYVNIGSHQLKVWLADSDLEHVQGLSGRSRLGEEEGMLFIFNESGPRSFWMKDMNFSIDIVWIDSNKQVLGITKNLEPTSWPILFNSPGDVQYVLEVPAGWVNKHRLEIGDKLRLSYQSDE